MECCPTRLFFFLGVAANLPPSFTADMNLHVVSEDTPVGAAVYTLKGADPEGGPVKYGLSGSDRLRVDPSSGVVTIARPLDREVCERWEVDGREGTCGVGGSVCMDLKDR